MAAISAVDREITTTSVPWYVVSPEAMSKKVDCNVGCEIAPRNNQQKIHRIVSMRATSRHAIARRTMMSIFLFSCRDEQTTTNTFFSDQSRGSERINSVKINGINQKMRIPPLIVY
jgi:hypothetical protein